LERTEAGRKPVRLAGIALSNFSPALQKKEVSVPTLFNQVLD